MVDLIARELRSLELTVWYDVGLISASDYAAHISANLRSARSVLVCWTNDAFPHGGDSYGWVPGEAEMGRNRGVLVCAALESPVDLDPPWNTVQFADLSAWHPDTTDRNNWRSLLRRIGEAGRLAHHPGRGEPAGWLARLYGAVGIALDLVAAAQHEVAVDRREPAGEPVGSGDGLPWVVSTDRVTSSSWAVTYSWGRSVVMIPPPRAGRGCPGGSRCRVQPASASRSVGSRPARRRPHAPRYEIKARDTSEPANVTGGLIGLGRDPVNGKDRPRAGIPLSREPVATDLGGPLRGAPGVAVQRVLAASGMAPRASLSAPH